MGNIIGAILLVILGIWVITATAHILLDILGVILLIAAVGLVVQYFRGTSRTRL